MENSEKINTCKTLLSYIINGFIIDDEKVPGLSETSELSNIDNTMLHIAVGIFCANNNIIITIDGDIDILPGMLGGAKGDDMDLVRRIANEEYPVDHPTITVKPKKIKSTIYNFLFVTTSVLSLALSTKSVYYLFEHTFKHKLDILEKSGNRLVGLVQNSPSPTLTSDYNDIFDLVGQYTKESQKTTEQMSSDLVLQEFTLNFSEYYEKLKGLNQTQLQLIIPPLDNPDFTSLAGLTKPVGSVLNIFRSGMSYMYEVRESGLESLLYNNEIYEKVQIQYEKTRDINIELQKLVTDFTKTIKNDISDVYRETEKPVLTQLTNALGDFVTKFRNGEPSTYDVAKTKLGLLKAIMDGVTRTTVTATTESTNVYNAIMTFSLHITDITGSIQTQVYITSCIYSFFQFILYLIYIKLIEKKVKIDDYNEILREIIPIIDDTVKDYFQRYRLEKGEPLKVLTELFIRKFYEKIINPNSGLIDYGPTARETIEANKEDIRKYIMDSIDILVEGRSRDPLLDFFLGQIFGQNNTFGYGELANMKKLIKIILKDPEDPSSTVAIRGGKKYYKNRRTRRRKTRKTRRHKTRKTRRHKRSRMNRRTRRN